MLASARYILSSMSLIVYLLSRLYLLRSISFVFVFVLLPNVMLLHLLHIIFFVFAIVSDVIFACTFYISSSFFLILYLLHISFFVFDFDLGPDVILASTRCILSLSLIMYLLHISFFNVKVTF